MRQALALLQAGHTAEATRLLAGLTPARTEDADHCLMAGLILAGAGQPRAALPWFDRALRLRPKDPAFLVQRAGALASAGDTNGALAGYAAAVAAGGDDDALHFDHANLLQSVGRLDEAIASYDAALRLRPAFPEALRAGARLLAERGHSEGALRFFAEAARLDPTHIDTWLDLTNLLQTRHRYGEALAAYASALTVLPGNAPLLTNRGIALLATGRLVEGVADLDAAIAADPGVPQAHMNRGNGLVWLGRPEEALAAYDAALAIRPAYAEALCGRGVAQKLLGDFSAALAATEAALALDPGFPHARAHRGELRLLAGDFSAGWPDYEYRFLAGRQERPVLKASVPFWTGEPIGGRRLAVFFDQGNGDKIQFARFLPRLASTGAVITIVCPARLRRLLGGLMAGLRVVEAVDDSEVFDRQVALSSLPFCLGVTREAISGAPYLAAEPALVAQWRARLGPRAFTVGLCWRGNQGWQVDPRRSVPLGAFAPLAALPGVRLVSLQMPDNAEAAGAAHVAQRLDAFADELDTGPDGFVDTAALMASLGLVVTCDTSIAHLAGALGRPVFVLLQAVPEWRWMTGGDTSPWYASARLFRQARRGAWDEPVAAIARAVEEFSHHPKEDAP